MKNSIARSIVAVFLCLSMVLGVLPTDLIGEDIAQAAAAAATVSYTEDPEFRELLERAEEGEERTSGEWRYRLFNRENYAVVTGHTNLTAQEINVPDLLEGADVVAIADNTFAGHENLVSVKIPVNVYAMGTKAIPRGTAVCAANASYGQKWAQRNGRAFRNISELPFRNEVIDLAETRPENFIRFSREEIMLRELEARRLKEGDRFFLPDPGNIYQISYYRAEEISKAENGFVTIRCSTPQIEEIVTHISAENQIMMPDYSTLKLEPGVELAGGQKRWSGKSSTSIPIKASIDHKMKNGAKLYAEVNYTTGWETSYDIGLFSSKEVKVVESRTLSIKGGVQSKNDLLKDEEYKDAKRILQDMIDGNYITRWGQSTKVPFKQKLYSVTVFSAYGIINIMADISVTAELSGKVEINYTQSSSTTYVYHNGDMTQDATSGKKDLSVKAEGNFKIGGMVSIDLYLVNLKVASLNVFVGIKITASRTIFNLHESDDQTADGVQFNINMADCYHITADFVVEYGFSLGIEDYLSLGYMRTLCSIPLLPDELHLHVHLNAFRKTGPGWNDWEDMGPKDNLHWAGECPYDFKTILFKAPTKDGNGYFRTLKTIDSVLPGDTVEAPGNETAQTIRDDFNRKLMGWHTDMDCTPDTEVAFPATIAKSDDMVPTHTLYDQTTLYARTTKYHTVELINSAGRRLEQFNAQIDRGVGTPESWIQDKAEIAGEETFTLPTEYTMQQHRFEIRQWYQVDSKTTRRVMGAGHNPGEPYTVEDTNEDHILLMALTDDDVVGHFVQSLSDPTKTMDIYCQTGGILSCPLLDDTISSEFTGWTATETDDPNDTVITTLAKGEDFSTDGQAKKDFTFYPNWTEKQNISFSGITGPVIGSLNGYTGGSTNIDDLDIDGNTIRGIRSGATVTHLSIPSSYNGVMITKIKEGAFSGNTSLRSVYIPGTITSIGYSAFSRCTNLKYIMADSADITEIPAGFAEGCSSLLGVSIPTGLQSVGYGAFTNCTSIHAIRLNGNIEGTAFAGCSGLSSISLGGACRSIGYNAFLNCTGLTEVTIPNCVNNLGDKIFQGCVNITRLTIAARTALKEATLQIGQGSKLEEVALEDGVTGLGDNALANGSYGFGQLTKISLPMTLKSIGANVFANSGIQDMSLYMPMTTLSGMLSMASYAFSGMHKLETLTVMGGKIPAYAFAGNEKLKTVNVLSGKIGSGAFSGCTGLQTVNLSDGVVSIGSYAFENCSGLKSLRIPDSVTTLGNYFIKGCNNITMLEIGGGVREITYEYDHYPFYIGAGSKLNTLILNDGITLIGNEAFTNAGGSGYATYSFPNLEYVKLPGTLNEIGSSAFRGAGIKELDLAKGLASAQRAFAGISTLEKVTIRGGKIGSSAFADCASLKEVILEDGVTEIDSYAFENCTGLTHMEIPDSVKVLGSYFIKGCNNITRLEIGGGIGKIEYEYGHYPLYIGAGSQLETVILSNGITEIDDEAFTNAGGSGYGTKYFPKLTFIQFPDTLTTIGSRAFSGTAISELDLKAGWASANYAFGGLGSLKKVRVRGGEIGSSAFCNCSGLEEVILEDGVTGIGSYAFENCSGLTSFSIPDSVTSLGDYFLKGCINVTTLKLGSGVKKLNNEYPHYPFYIGAGSQLKNLIIGEGVTEIGDQAFNNGGGSGYNTAYFPELTHIELPGTLTKIGTRPFSGTAIKSLDLKEGQASTYYAFSGMRSLEEVTIRGGEIAGNAFADCTGLKRVNLEDGVTSIGSYAFENCTGLTYLSIPDSVTSLGDYFLKGCINITTLKLGNGVKKLTNEYPHYSFYIGSEAKLKNLIISEGVTEIGDGAFNNGGGSGYGTRYFTKLEHIELPGSLTKLGSNAFSGAPASDFVLGAGLASTYSAFRGQTTLKKVTIKGGSIGEYAFSDCTGLEEVKLEDVTSIGYNAFENCTGLKSLTIPDSVTAIGDRFLSGCKNLQTLKIGNGIPNLSSQYNYYPFYIGEGSRLKTLILGEGITDIGSSTFCNYGGNYVSSNPMDYPELEFVTLPTTLRTIGNGNLCRWKKVKTLGLPDGLTSIEDSSLSADSGMALYSLHYNQTIANFAQQKGLSYSCQGQFFPKFRIRYVVPNAGMQTRGLLRSDGTMRGTRGTEGEETTIPEGFAVLSEAELAFMDAVEADEPAYQDGYAFYGWYTDPEYITPWQMNTMPGADVTLYAKIKPLIRIRYAVNMAGEEDENLPEGFSLWTEYRTRDYGEVPQTEDPAPAGYTFQGWFTDADFTIENVPARVSTEDITLYGKLSKAPAGAVYRLTGDTYTLTEYRKTADGDENVSIPAKVNGIAVTAIGARAFRDSNVKAVRLPDSIEQIDREAFAESEIHTIRISRNNAAYTTKGGALYSKDGSTLIRWPDGKRNTSITIPAGTTRIDSYAFGGNQYLTEVTFNSELEEIGQGAFSGCENLARVVLPDSVTTLEDDAFAGCNRITYFQAYGLAGIGTNAISAGTGMEVRGPIGDNPLRRVFVTETEDGRTVTWGYNQFTVKLYVDGALAEQTGCEAGYPLIPELKNVTFPDGTQINKWYRDSGFGTEWDLDNDVMPEGELCLYGSKSPTYSSEEITLTREGREITGIRLTAYNGKAREMTIPETYNGSDVIALGGGLLGSCSDSVTVITIPAGIIDIGNSALINSAGTDFSGTIVCDGDSYAAQWAEGHGYITRDILYRLTLRERADKELHYDLAKGTEQRLPSPARAGETFLGWFEDESLTTTAELTENCYRMPGEARTLYGGWSKTEETQNLHFTWEEKDRGVVITGYTGGVEAITIPATIGGTAVTAIGPKAFSGKRFRSIDLGSVSSIGEEAFANCDTLAQIILPDSVTNLGEQAFAECDGLRSIMLGSGLSDFPTSAVQGCNRLTAITVSATSEWMSSEEGVLFSKDKTMLICYPKGKSNASYTVPDDTAQIGRNAFRDATMLEELTIQGALTDIGEGAFSGCTGLKSVEASGLTYIGENAFFGCTGMETFDPGERLEFMGNHAFLGCDRLTEAHIPESATLTETDVLFTSTEGLIITGRWGSSAWTYARVNGIAFNDPEARYVTEINLDEGISQMALGETIPLIPRFEPANAEAGTECSWSVENEQIAFVDQENQIRAIGTGETMLTVKTSNGVRKTIPIEVYVPVERVTAQTPYNRLFTMAGYETETAMATVYPANATDPAMSWESSDPSVLTVDENGTITAVNPGTAQITARSTGRFGENKSKSLTITVCATERKMTLPNSLTAIMEQAFEGNRAVQCVIIPNATRSIGEKAFAGMDSLTLAIIPGNVTEIAEDAFEGSDPVIAAPEESEGYHYALNHGLIWMKLK